MKLYHVSLNEYRDYEVDHELFTSEEDIRKWILDEIERFLGDEIDVTGKSIYQMANEYNDNNYKYGMIINEYEMPNLKEEN